MQVNDTPESAMTEEIGADDLLARMLDISTVGIIFFDPSGDIVEANDTFLRMSGFSRTDLEAGRLRWDALTPPEWMPASVAAISQLKTRGSTVPYEKEYFRKDGTRFRGLFAAKGLSEHRGVEFILDTSENYRAQELLKQSEERFRQLSESSPIGVFQADLNGSVTYTNAKAQEIFAMSEAELLGQGWLRRLCPEDAQRVVERWTRAIQADESYETEYRLQMPDGEIRMVCAHSVMLHEDGGKPFGVVGTLENITARKRAEATLRETEKLAAVGRLASSIAHEINNPLEAVTNLLFLARSSTDLNEIQGYLDHAERELRRVSVISNQTLRFHKHSTVAGDLAMNDLFNDALAIYQGKLINSHIRVVSQCAPDLTLRCLDGEIRQVLNNLIGNAVDAMQPAGGRLLLRCRKATNWADHRAGIAITVADTGTGMSPAVQKRIFEAFYTTKGMNGTGLGLWISNEIVSHHQGRLAMRSTQRPGAAGTVFRLFLPLNALGPNQDTA